jgi:hypothetical protein
MSGYADDYNHTGSRRLLRAYEEHDAKLASALGLAIIEGAYRSLISTGWTLAGTNA